VKRALLFIALACCVPASEKAPPAGAAGFDTAPSPATRGEPYVTNDGWTVTIDKLILQVTVAAQPSSRGYGETEPYIFDARSPQRIFVRALPTGPALLRIDWYGRYVDETDRNRDPFENIEALGVTRDDARRFLHSPDDAKAVPYSAGPSMELATTGTNGGRTVHLDLAVNVTSVANYKPTSEVTGYSVTIPEDGIDVVPLPLGAEALFVTFADIAAHDGDGDGIVTVQELGTDLVELKKRLATLISN